MNRKRLELATTIAAFVFFIAVWEGVSRSGFFNINLFTPPSVVFQALIESVSTGEYYSDIMASTFRVLAGFVIGSALGIILGIATGRVRLLSISVGQIANFLRNIPSIAFVPLALVWFGIDESSKVFLVTWGVIFPVWVNTHQGMARLDENYLWSIKSLGANKLQAFKEVIFPNAMPFIATGLRIGIALAFITLVAAEMAGASSGIGYRISVSHLIFRVDKMLLGITTLGVMGLFADRVLLKMINRLFPWIRLE